MTSTRDKRLHQLFQSIELSTVAQKICAYLIEQSDLTAMNVKEVIAGLQNIPADNVLLAIGELIRFEVVSVSQDGDLVFNPFKKSTYSKLEVSCHD